MSVLETKFKSHPHANHFLLLSEMILGCQQSQVPHHFPNFFPQIEICRLEDEWTPCKSPCWPPVYLEPFNVILCCTHHRLDGAGSPGEHLLGWLWFLSGPFSCIWGQSKRFDVSSMAEMEQVKQVANLCWVQRGKKNPNPANQTERLLIKTKD